ncbi:secreted protein [Beggiatoa sp. PS]|nr:secreted protein [Beggiatoa sp. PS]
MRKFIFVLTILVVMPVCAANMVDSVNIINSSFIENELPQRNNKKSVFKKQNANSLPPEYQKSSIARGLFNATKRWFSQFWRWGNPEDYEKLRNYSSK